MEQFTKNFSYDELIASSTAKRLGLDNTPSYEEKEKLRQGLDTDEILDKEDEDE